MNALQESPPPRTYGLLGLLAIALAAALLAGFWLGPQDAGRPRAAAGPENARPPEPPRLQPQPVTTAPATPKPQKPAVEEAPPAIAPKDPHVAEGEVLGGLQFVVSVNKLTVEPGEQLQVSWKLVNHLDSPVKFLDVKPAIIIEKADTRAVYVAAGANRRAMADDLKDLGPRVSMPYVRGIEWPRPQPRIPADWPDFSLPGRYHIHVSFKGDASIPEAADALKKERGLDVYCQPLTSKPLTITVRGEPVQRPPAGKPPEVVDEDF